MTNNNQTDQLVSFLEELITEIRSDKYANVNIFDKALFIQRTHNEFTHIIKTGRQITLVFATAAQDTNNASSN